MLRGNEARVLLRAAGCECLEPSREHLRWRDTMVLRKISQEISEWLNMAVALLAWGIRYWEPLF